MGLIKTLVNMYLAWEKDEEHKQSIREAVLELMKNGPKYHEWSISEIREKLGFPTSINEVETALKVLMKKNVRMRKRVVKRYFYD